MWQVLGRIRNTYYFAKSEFNEIIVNSTGVEERFIRFLPLFYLYLDFNRCFYQIGKILAIIHRSNYLAIMNRYCYSRFDCVYKFCSFFWIQPRLLSLFPLKTSQKIFSVPLYSPHRVLSMSVSWIIIALLKDYDNKKMGIPDKLMRIPDYIL